MSTEENTPSTDDKDKKRAERLARLKELHFRRVRFEESGENF